MSLNLSDLYQDSSEKEKRISILFALKCELHCFKMEKFRLLKLTPKEHEEQMDRLLLEKASQITEAESLYLKAP